MIKINFFGDFVATDAEQLAVDGSLRERLEEADFNIVNFEAPIAKPDTAEKVLKSGPSLEQDANAPRWLAENGFNVAVLANNHIMDFGGGNSKATEAAFKKLGVQTCGIGRGLQAYEPLILERNGVKVGILSMAELQFGMVHDLWTQQDTYGVAWMNHPTVNHIVRETKAKVDYLVFVAHAGLEGVDVPLPEWRDRYRELIDEGCDAVIGGHTHTAQGYEIYHGKPIFYSLGNFCFQKLLSAERYWRQGEGVSLSFDADGGMKFDVFGTELMTDGMLTLRSASEWESYQKTLNGLLASHRYMEEVDKVCLSMLPSYNSLFARGGFIPIDRHLLKNIGRWLLGRCHNVHMLNNVQCESHRWTLSRAMRLKYGID